jgi:hypothetical protein
MNFVSYNKKGSKILVQSNYMMFPDNHMTHVITFTGFSSYF